MPIPAIAKIEPFYFGRAEHYHFYESFKAGAET